MRNRPERSAELKAVAVMTVSPRTQSAKALCWSSSPERLPWGSYCGTIWGVNFSRLGANSLCGQCEGRAVPSARGSSRGLQCGGVCWTQEPPWGMGAADPAKRHPLVQDMVQPVMGWPVGWVKAGCEFWAGGIPVGWSPRAAGST